MVAEQESQQDQKILASFQSEDGVAVGPPLNLPVSISPAQLELILNQILQNTDKVSYNFTVDSLDVVTSLQTDILKPLQKSTENAVMIVYRPQALFKIRPVSRCSSSLAGHSDSILSVLFSPDGTRAISASGDTTVRLWDFTTETPKTTCKAHTNWVLCVAWSPDGKMFASGGMDSSVYLWDGYTGALIGLLKGHTKWITSLAWEPYHASSGSGRLASSSKDGTVRVWNTQTRLTQMVLSQHTDAISTVKWGGSGLIYTGSRDKTIKCWSDVDGKLCMNLVGHAHWVNTMALSTEHALRTGPYDHKGQRPWEDDKAKAAALERYNLAKGTSGERLITGSDDFTMFLWQPSVSKKPVARLTGHQQIVNHVTFSPDGRLIASASFDKSIKLWDGHAGTFLSSLRAHVSPVYQVSFSADSRLLLSASKDSTLKLWDVKTKKMKVELPGHLDEVYSVDWSPSGSSSAISGGKDKTVKFWKE